MRHPQHEGHLQGLLRPQQGRADFPSALDDDEYGASARRGGVLGAAGRGALGPAAAMGDQQQRDTTGAARGATAGPVATAHGPSARGGRGGASAPALARVPAATAAAQAARTQDVRRARGGRQAVFQEDRREPRQAAKRDEGQERGAGEQRLVAGLGAVGGCPDRPPHPALQHHLDENKMKQSLLCMSPTPRCEHLGQEAARLCSATSANGLTKCAGRD